jgi:arginyl-tRNA synthetase
MMQESKKRFDAEADFKARAHAEVVKLQAGDAVNVAIWTRLRDASAVMFQGVYQRLGVDSRLYLRGESFYNDKLVGTVDELRAKGFLADMEGALVMWAGRDGQPPLIVRVWMWNLREWCLHVQGSRVSMVCASDVFSQAVKSDGGIGYDSTDLAAIRFRFVEQKKDWVVYVVDSGQALHFEVSRANLTRCLKVHDRQAARAADVRFVCDVHASPPCHTAAVYGRPAGGMGDRCASCGSRQVWDRQGSRREALQVP